MDPLFPHGRFDRSDDRCIIGVIFGLQQWTRRRMAIREADSCGVGFQLAAQVFANERDQLRGDTHGSPTRIGDYKSTGLVNGCKHGNAIERRYRAKIDDFRLHRSLRKL